MPRMPLVLVPLCIMSCEPHSVGGGSATDAAPVTIATVGATPSADAISSAVAVLPDASASDSAAKVQDTGIHIATIDAGPKPFQCGTHLCQATQYCIELSIGPGTVPPPGQPRTTSIRRDCSNVIPHNGSIACGRASPDRHVGCVAFIPRSPPRP